MPDTRRIAKAVLDEGTAGRRGARVERELEAAISGLLEGNRFAPVGSPEGPYNLYLSTTENRLVFDVRDLEDGRLVRFTLPLGSFRSIVRDYFTLLDSYFEALKAAPPPRIETLDMGRRALHDEGGELLRERLAGKVDVDSETARRLFTLICVLHIRDVPE